jgi:hypothetical protein
MRICNLLILLFLLAISDSSYAKNNTFFPDEITNELKTDLTGFLQRLPKNQGQRGMVEEVLSYSEYKKMLLFIDSPFSFKNINQASNLKSPFLLMETLDDLSYNLNLKIFFSDWYISKLILLVQEKPELYMPPFLRFCQKSDGAYAEGLADPLAEIIINHPEEFSRSLQSLNNAEKLCGILATGDYQFISKGMNKLAHYNKTKNIKIVNDLLDCFAPYGRSNRNPDGPADAHPGGGNR